jgi:hypothetical protein
VCTGLSLKNKVNRAKSSLSIAYETDFKELFGVMCLLKDDREGFHQVIYWSPKGGLFQKSIKIALIMRQRNQIYTPFLFV